MSSPLTPEQKKFITAAMMVGVRQDKLSIIQSALEKGADANELLFVGIEKNNFSWVTCAVENGADVNSVKIINGETKPVFIRAHECFNEKISTYLLSKGVSVDTLDSRGNTPLLKAIKDQSWTKIKFYADHGADPLIVCNNNVVPLDEMTKLVEEKHSLADGIYILEKLLKNIQTASATSPVTQPTHPPGLAQDIPMPKLLKPAKPSP